MLKTRTALLPTLILMSALAPLAMNIIVPSVPQMVEAFESKYSVLQMTVSVFLGMYGLSQLFTGVLSDRFGRRPVAIAGAIIFLAGSLVCFFADSVENLILGRILQAAGGGVGVVVSDAILVDSFSLNKAASKMAYLIVAVLAVPMMSPTIGGFIDELMGWRSNFLLTAIIAAGTILAIAITLPETRPKDASDRITPGIDKLGDLFSSKEFVVYGLVLACIMASFYGFVGGGPHVLITQMGLTPSEYGLYYLAGSAFFATGSLITGVKSTVWGVNRLIKIGLFCSVSGSMLQFFFLQKNSLDPNTMFIGVAIMVFGQGLVVPAATTLAVAAAGKWTGFAAGVVGCVQLLFGAFAAYIAGLMLDQTAVPLLVLMFVSTLSAFLLNQSYGMRAGRETNSSG